jgi:ATP-dependent DNA helicase PIF1
MRFHFITGGAGVGKSHMLRTTTEAETDKFITVAPTGIAAINAGGATIHSAFKINPSDGFVNPQIKYGALRGLQKIYIDEISMVSDELMRSLHTAAEMLGVEEIIGFGDLAQLKPVSGGWFFEYMEPTQITTLTKNYRQGDDLEFADRLNAIRKGEHTQDTIAFVNTNRGNTNDGVTLAFANATVNRINAQQLSLIDRPVYTFSAQLFGNISERDVPGVPKLELKVGAKVIMLVNDKAKRFQNGTRGTVVALDNGKMWVEINGVVHTIAEHTWQKQTPRKLTEEREAYWREVTTNEFAEEEMIAKAHHNLRNGYEMETVGTFTQFPMKLGYASTVHKAQGLTLDRVVIDPQGFDSMHGLGYVALSRLTSLEGLTVFRNLRRVDFLTNSKVKPYL